MDDQNEPNKPVRDFTLMFERLETLLTQIIQEDTSIVELMRTSCKDIKCDIEKAEAMQKLLKNMFSNNQHEQA